MRVQTPDGPVDFPDSMSQGDIEGVLQKKYGGAPAPAPAPDPNMPPEWAMHPLGKISKFFDTVGDTMTFGLADTLAGGLGGKTQQMRDATAQNRADIGPVASGAADLIGYAAGPGAAGAGTKLATRMGGGLLARMGGSAAENAAAAGAGTLGHGGTVGDALKDAAIGGVVGGVTGAIPTSAGTVAHVSPTADLGAAKDAAYAGLTQKFNGSKIGDALLATTKNMDAGLQSKMSDSLSSQVAKVAKIAKDKGSVTANDIADFYSSLRGAAQGGEDYKLAQKYIDRLNKGVGSAAGDIASADAAHNAFKTSAEIDDWLENPSAARASVRSRLEDKPQFYNNAAGPGLASVAKLAPNPPTGDLGRQVAGHIVKGALRAGVGAGASALLGGGLGTDLAAGAITAALPAVPGRFYGNMAKNRLRAAQQALNGVDVSPTSMRDVNPISDWAGWLARNAGYGAGAAGAYPRSGP